MMHYLNKSNFKDFVNILEFKENLMLSIVLTLSLEINFFLKFTFISKVITHENFSMPKTYLPTLLLQIILSFEIRM